MNFKGKNVRCDGGDSSEPSMEEITLLEVLFFLKGAWKTIIIIGLFGMMLSGIFLIITPNQYEAIIHIVMGRISVGGLNIEEPLELINRMNSPAGIDDVVREACDLRESINQPTQLSKTIKFYLPKGVPNVVELKVLRQSPQVARTCAKSIYESIVKHQQQAIASQAQVLRARSVTRLAKVEDRLHQNRVLLGRINSSNSSLKPAYFTLLTETRNLEDERETLLSTLNYDGAHAAYLQAPIYVSATPVYPKKLFYVVVGILGGLFLGLLVALGRRMRAN